MSIETSQTSHRANAGEHGIILPLLAIFTVMIISFVALAVDTARLAVSKQQQKRTVQLSSLAALEAYREATPDSAVFPTPLAQHNERLRIAIDRAEQVAGFTRNALLGRPGESQANDASDDLGSSGAAGQVVPGRYFFDEPGGPNACDPASANAYTGANGADGCPCGGGTWDGPCFLPLAAGETEAKSFQVRLSSKTTSPIQNVFGRIMGQSEVSLSSWGSSAIVPRHGVYPIDLSGSMAEETHLPPEALATGALKARASLYTFRVTNVAACADGAVNPCVTALGLTFALPRHTQIWYGTAPAIVDPLNPLYLPGMAPTRPAGPPYQPRWRHYRDDYTCWNLALEDVDNDGILERGIYLVDTHIHPYDNGPPDGVPDGTIDGFYRGPEPLSSVLSGMQEALTTISSRSVAGDGIGVLGFDIRAQDSRIFPYTYPGHPDYQDLIDITTLPTSGDMQNSGDPNTRKRLLKGYFPIPAGYTDITEAVLRSSMLLKDMPNSTSAQSYVAMFTDGLPTVAHPGSDFRDFIYDSAGTPTLRDDSPRVPPDGPGTYCPMWSFLSAHNTIWDALGESATLVSGSYPGQTPTTNGFYPAILNSGWTTYLENKIAFNAVIFGTRTNPHTMLYKSPLEPTKCITDADARKTGSVPDFVTSMDQQWRNHGGRWITLNQTFYGRMAAGENTPYYLSQEWFYRSMVYPTGGFWVPIRPACDLAAINARFGTTITTAQCQGSNAVQELVLDPVCAASAAPRVTGSTAALADLLAAGVTANQVGSLPNCAADPLNPPWLPIERGQHRLICDTKCRTAEQQIREFIRNLYAQNPYVLVKAAGE